MTTGTLPPATADRLAKLCGMLGSSHHGERANAAAMADRMVREAGLTWPQVIGASHAPKIMLVEGPPRRLTSAEVLGRILAADLSELEPRERTFLSDMKRRRTPYTVGQDRWLRMLGVKVRVL